MISQSQALDALKSVIDPDVGINIVDLGMVELVAADDSGVRVALIMTTPACPQSGYLRDESLHALERAGAVAPTVEVLDAPLWSPERLSDDARKVLGW